MKELIFRGRPFPLGPFPKIMGILNATPDSFSDGGSVRPLSERIRQLIPLLRRNVRAETGDERAEDQDHQPQIDECEHHPSLFNVTIDVHHQIFSVHMYPVALMVFRQTSRPYSASILRKRKMFISITEVPVVE